MQDGGRGGRWGGWADESGCNVIKEGTDKPDCIASPKHCAVARSKQHLAQRAEHNDLVQPVQELRPEMPASGAAWKVRLTPGSVTRKHPIGDKKCASKLFVLPFSTLLLPPPIRRMQCCPGCEQCPSPLSLSPGRGGPPCGRAGAPPLRHP